VEITNGGDFKPVRNAGMPQVPNEDFPSVHLGGFDWRIYQRSLPAAEPAVAGTGPVQIGSAH
jgi:hypothetical protein